MKGKDSKQTLPAYSEKFLKLFLSPFDAESIAGDLEDDYIALNSSKGRIIAGLWLWFQILMAAWNSISVRFSWNMAILNTHLKGTWRNIRRQKIYSLINITGLAVGMTCCMLILLWIRHEKSYDRFHVHKDELFRIIMKSEDGVFHSAATVGLLADYLEKEYPEILLGSNLADTQRKITHKNNSFISQGLLVNPGFLEMFTFPIIKGDKKTALEDSRSVVITSDLAEKLCGEEAALGKVVWIDDRIPLKITGIVENIPHNSSIHFDFLLPYLFHRQNRDDWNWRDVRQAYILIREDSSFQKLSSKITEVYNQHNPGEPKEFLYLQPFTDVHLYTPGGGGLITYVNMFSVLAALVLIIACINFMNLTTACSEKRIKEIGIKRIVGSTRSQLIQQFINEAMLHSFVALLFAVALVYLLLPSLGTLVGKSLNLHLSFSLIMIFLLIAGLTGLFSGLLPALYLSSFRPVAALKNQLSFGTAPLRKILVVVQFSLSIIFIISTLVIVKQINFISTKDLGFAREQVISIPLEGNITLRIQAVKRRLHENSDVESVSASSNDLRIWDSSGRVFLLDGDSQRSCVMGMAWVDYDFAETMKIELAAGRFFSQEYPTDLKQAWIINESAAKALGLEEPLGKELVRGLGRPWRYSAKIIGVVKDFHTQSLHQKVHPFLLIPSHNAGLNNLWIRIRTENIPEALAAIESDIREVYSNYPVTIQFLDEKIQDLYQNEYLTVSLVKYITVLAIFISCLGLLGLSSFSVERRIKEIGVRKVLGSSISQIILLFLKDFMKWIMLANLLAWPLAWYALHRWLQRFAYRTEISWYLFFLSGVAALIIAAATVSSHALKIAHTDPVDSLRHE